MTWYCVLSFAPFRSCMSARVSGPFARRGGAERAAVALLSAGAHSAEVLDGAQAKAHAKNEAYDGASQSLCRFLAAHPPTLHDSLAAAARCGDRAAAAALHDLALES